MPNHFTYSGPSLDPARRQVCLLRAKPQRHNDPDGHSADGVPNYEIKVFSLKYVPRYRALSYCWGVAEPTKRIYLNDELFLVRANVCWFLSRLHEEPDPPLWVFIDAICINQQDMDERSGQVGLMGDVYRGAWEVIAMLGDGADPLPSAANLMLGVDFRCDQPQWQHTLDSIAAGKVWEAARRLIVGAQQESTPDLLNVLDRSTAMDLTAPLVAQPFWSRLWIIQEIILAKRLTFWYDTIRVDWTVLFELLKRGFSDILSAENKGKGEIKHFIDRQSHESTFDFARSSLLVYRILEGKVEHSETAREGNMSISTAFLFWGDQNCSVAHDKLYGLLGMTASVIQPNYSAKILNVYATYLVEGLVEIMYQYAGDNRQRALQSAHYAVQLAGAFGLNIGDRGEEAIDITKYGLGLVGQGFKNTSELWIRTHELKFNTFKHFGPVGTRLWMKAPVFVHKIRAFDLACDELWEDYEWFDTWKEEMHRKRNFVVAKRFLNTRQHRELLDLIPQIALMTAENAEALLSRIIACEASKAKAEMATLAMQHVQAEKGELQGHESRLEQDHLRKLETFEAVLRDQIADLERDGHVVARPSALPAHVGRLLDLRLVMDFLAKPGFFSHVNWSEEQHQLAFARCLGAVMSQELQAPEVMAVMSARRRDAEFIAFTHLAANIHYVGSGQYALRQADDPSYQPLSAFYPTAQEESSHEYLKELDACLESLEGLKAALEEPIVCKDDDDEEEVQRLIDEMALTLSPSEPVPLGENGFGLGGGSTGVDTGACSSQVRSRR